MHLKAVRWILLLAVVILQAGCAAETYDPTTDLQPAPSRDDSHGWSGNFSAGSR